MNHRHSETWQEIWLIRFDGFRRVLGSAKPRIQYSVRLVAILSLVECYSISSLLLFLNFAAFSEKRQS